MKCKHCNFELDDDYDICPECGKPLKDEPEEEKVELPKVKDETSLTQEDAFTANFISKDDPLKHISEVKDTSAGIKSARIAMILAIIFFAGVLYYSYVYLPKHKPKQEGGIHEIIDDYNPGDYPPSTETNTTGEVEFPATFGDETINTILKKNGFIYEKDMYNVNITLDYGKLSNGQNFKLLLLRTASGNTYSDTIAYMLNDMRVNSYTKTYLSYSEDLITNMINSYVVKEFDGGIVLYTTASTFQLGFSNPILFIKGNKTNTLDKVITTYSPDGTNITKCPITLNEDTINYCVYAAEWKKGENVDLRNISYKFDNEEVVKGTFQGMISK